jgi:hypothetical protein
MMFEDLYDYLESHKHALQFRNRDDVETEIGKSKFQTLFFDSKYQDVPQEIKEVIEQKLNLTSKDYDFLQIQKYEIGDYILPHRDAYPHFNLLMISSSGWDGLTMEDENNNFCFIPDKAGTIINIPKYKWHWVNPVREKTRYTAVTGINSLHSKLDEILAI